MVRPNEGHRFRSKITGHVYDIKKVVNHMVVMDSIDGSSQILTEWKNLRLFYEREPRHGDDQTT